MVDNFSLFPAIGRLEWDGKQMLASKLAAAIVYRLSPDDA